MKANKGLSASMEDYLEAIFHITARKQAAKAKDIAHRLKVNNSSVTGALRNLASKKLINYAPYDVITLTAKGKNTAEEVIRRHETLRRFFVEVLAVENDDADHSACKMEHYLPQNLLERFTHFIEFVHHCPRVGPQWLEKFINFCDRQTPDDNCVSCLSTSLEQLIKGKDPQSLTSSSTNLSSWSQHQ